MNTRPDEFGAGDDHGTSAGAGEFVEVDALLPADSPRLAGVNQEHVRMLAGTGARLPPILVCRRTMRVIDGMHRLCAMRLRGARRIEVRFFSGTEDAAFLAAVRENVSHGLPLLRADREAAVLRIMDSSPGLSDRVIASVCGVSRNKVAAIRRRSSVQKSQLHARVGLDGRVRPLDIAEGRRAAKELIQARPDASLREIAKVAGVSPNTVRDVRARMQRGEDPVPAQRQKADHGDGRRSTAGKEQLKSGADHDQLDVRGVLLSLKRDPSIRFTDAGRRLLHWLDVHAANFESWSDLVEVIPPYHAYSVVALARRCAQVWEAFADRLDSHPVSIGIEPPVAQ